jgi:hypothetical protein
MRFQSRQPLGAIGKVDAIASAVGSAVFKPLTALTDADFEKSLHDWHFIEKTTAIARS